MKLSIRAKLLGLTVAMLLAAILTYLVLAVRMFESDKTAYIYDGNAALVGALAAEVEATLNGVAKTMNAVSAMAADPGVFASPAAAKAAEEALFKGEPDLVDLGVKGAQFTNPNGLAAAGVDASFLTTLHRLKPLSSEVVPPGGLLVQSATIDGGPPLALVATATAVGTMRLDRILQLFAKSELYETVLFDAGGQVLAHSGEVAPKRAVAEILSGPMNTGVKEVTDGATTFIAAYAKLGVAGLTVVSEIDKDKAFQATHALVHKSLLFAAAILLVALMISTVASRQITTPIRRLYLATRRISKGEFNVQVAVRTRDEVGELARSFNRMTKEIVRLLAQVRDKARMEKELETAKHVQETLFPEPTYHRPGLDLASYYTPASECGGDWCGYFEVGSKLIVLIGDATGHGVPAALITAAAQSCATTLVDGLRQRPEAPVSAGAFVGALNRAIHAAARGRVKMTFFASVIDPATRKMTYVNASHELPIIVHPPGAAKRRELLSGAPDACLGEDPATTYQEHVATLAPGDLVVWYTDGLLECRDKAKEEWGEWRFVKSLEAHAAGSAAGLKDGIVADAMTFSDGGERDDDITLVVAKLAAAS